MGAAPADTRSTELTAEPVSTESLLGRRRIVLRGRSLRQHAARGTIVNATFSVTMALIALLRGFLIARFLTRADYGIWGILVAAVVTLVWLKQIGIGDKYIQQTDDEDAELAFQRAWTVECIVSGAFMALMIVAAPVVALVYGRPELLVPGLALTLLMPAQALSAPLWVFYRQLRYARQRLVQAVDPILSTVVAISLAIAGFGYWSLLLGVLAGAWGAAVVTLLVSPYRLRFRLGGRTLRSYLSFSWPLFVASGSGLVIVQCSLFFGTTILGVAAAGAITLAANVSLFAENVDQIVSGTMYPVVCAVQDRLDLLYESFVKSNRVALLWAMPFGLGLTLFAGDLVRFGLGARWHAAVPLLEAFGLTAAIGHLGFNWDDYFRARSDTRPMAWAAFLTMVSFVVSLVPLLYLWGLKGFAVAVGIQMVVNVACRVFFLRRLFDGFDMLRHAARAMAPTVPAVLAVLAVRAVEPSGLPRLGLALGELGVYAVVTVVATLLLERPLLVEMAGYLRSRGRGAPVVAA